MSAAFVHFGSFLEGAVAGDFSAGDSWSKTGGQIVGGLIPIYSQLADHYVP